MIFIGNTNSPIGKIIIAEENGCLIGCWFDQQKHCCSLLKNQTIIYKKTDIINKSIQWLDRYFKKENPSLSELKIELRGTNFQTQVWNKLLKIPYGTIANYSEIAKAIASDNGVEKMSSQAVGNAIAHNPISIFVPCHRVISKNGNLTGYAGGLDKKQYLLMLEKNSL